MPSILQVGGEPCIQPQLVQALGDGVVFNQELKCLARLANCILYLWPRSSVRLDPTGWLPPGHPPSAQRIQAQCGPGSTWVTVASRCQYPTVPSAWHPVSFPICQANPAALGTCQADTGGHQWSQAQWQDKEIDEG